MANITITQEVREVNITVEQDGVSYTLQPVIVLASNDTGDFMRKSIYDPANKNEQVLTITSDVDGGTL